MNKTVKATVDASRPILLITVEGGVVQTVSPNRPEIFEKFRTIVLDFDSPENADEGAVDIVSVRDAVDPNDKGDDAEAREVPVEHCMVNLPDLIEQIDGPHRRCRF